MSEKIGIGIITCDRPKYVKNLINSINKEKANIDEFIVIDDGREKTKLDNQNISIINTSGRIGVAKSKNKALKYLLEKGCTHLFLIEDDVIILDQTVFKQYINACKLTGIQHFNYGPGTPFNRKQSIKGFDIHNRELLEQTSEPNPKLIVDYKNCKIAIYEHVAGMFSYFSREILEKGLGFMNEVYDGCWEHVCGTYDVIKAGYHPPFWAFADLANSHELLTEAPDAIENSTIAKDKTEWYNKVAAGSELYKQKHGHYPNQAPQPSQDEIIRSLKEIKKNYGNG
jgi:glycosyltransferase involved in cell wall biosynthesis